jgi:hypothetical protein
VTSAIPAVGSVHGVRLVEELVPHLVDPVTDRPWPGLEEHWSQITDYRVWIALEQRDYIEPVSELAGLCEDLAYDC